MSTLQFDNHLLLKFYFIKYFQEEQNLFILISSFETQIILYLI